MHASGVKEESNTKKNGEGELERGDGCTMP